MIVCWRNVSYEAGGRQILRDINLTVEQGETLVLLGRSGSGKTTLLRTANRLIEPTSGEVAFEGQPVAGQDPIRLRRRMGYVIQEGGLFPHFTVERNVGLVPTLEQRPSAEVRDRVHALLRQVGLPPERYAARYPRQLSGGEKQRVGIARALAAGPPLLLLDEPFAALDPVTRFGLQKQFLALRDELRQTSVFVTHDIREALMLASRIVLLKDGAVAVTAAPDEFLASSHPEALAFLESLTREWRTDAPGSGS